MPTDRDESEMVVRRTLPTASFTLTKSQIQWIAEESKRRQLTKAELIRDLLEQAMSESKQVAAGVAA